LQTTVYHTRFWPLAAERRNMDFDRRDFLAAAGVTGLGLLSTGSVSAQSFTTDADAVQEAPILVGDRPELGDPFFEDKIRYAYLHRDDGGSLSKITQDDSAWQPLSGYQQDIITDSSDLPEPQNGVHPLERKVYAFQGFVDSPYGLDISAGPALIGRHGSQDGFIHTGQQTAIYGRGGGLFMRDMYVHSPGGQVFDVAGDQTTEMLVESSAFSDAAGIGAIAKLGVFDGMRVPTFKGCNFEDFAAGLTFTGTPDKVFVSNSPLRGVVASGATILEFDANLEVGIVDLPNNYIKDVQSDTEVVHVDPNATITEIFQYIKNTHDSSVTKSNILTGAAGTNVVGYRVKNSYPIVDSVAIGNYSLDTDSTVTISTQATDKNDAAAYETVPGTTTSEVNARFDMGDNQATYLGKKDTQTELNANLSGDTKNGDLIAVAWFNDDTIVPGTATRFVTQGSGFSVGTPMTSNGVCPNCLTGSTYDIRVANLESTDDIDVGEMNGLLKADV